MIKKDTWYVLGNGLQTRFRGKGKAGWESKDLPFPFPIEYTNDGTCTCTIGSSFDVSHERSERDLKDMIGHKASKVSGDGKRATKPFKSGNEANTVKELVVSPFTGNPAFSFEDDDSIVDCDICRLII